LVLVYIESQGSFVKAFKLAQIIRFGNFVGLHNRAHRLYLSQKFKLWFKVYETILVINN